MKRGDRIQLTIERPAAGGRMIARHDGAVIFVAGAIPGEIVDAEIEKVQRNTAFAMARTIIEASPDRVPALEGNCGGAAFAHIAYQRQRLLKAAIIDDAFKRIGRIPLEAPVEVVASPVDGYRMRARLHLRDGRIGFFREGSHAICDAAATRQLRGDTIDVVRRLEASLATLPRQAVGDLDVSENVGATERAVHLELLPDGDPSALAGLAAVDGVSGASCAHPENPRTIELFGNTIVTDEVCGVRFERHVRSFFQGNRHLLEPFTEWVISHVEDGPLVDLYAGVGLFSLTAQSRTTAPITAVEGDRFAARDLQRNAKGSIAVLEVPVEQFVNRSAEPVRTVIVDPPRTGMSKDALARAMAIKASRFVYVSCDVATLARDARVLLDQGYRMSSVRAFDLFPNTAHVETVISFDR